MNRNTRNPKKFWKSINDLIKDKIDIDINNVDFIDQTSGLQIDKDSVPDFLKIFFANMAEKTRGSDDGFDNIRNTSVGGDNLPGFDLGPVTVDCFQRFIFDIDLDMSSCIDGINMKLCKIILENFLEKWAKLYSNSFYSGIFPKEWACSVITMLPKNGDPRNPGNWRPFS